jgi:predicted Zn-dependent protease
MQSKQVDILVFFREDNGIRDYAGARCASKRYEFDVVAYATGTSNCRASLYSHFLIFMWGY